MRPIYLAYGRAISLAVPYESIIVNGTVAAGAVSILPGSARAVGSAMRGANGEFFIAVTPQVAWVHEGPDAPPPVTVACSASECTVERQTSSSLVFVALKP